MNQGSVPMSFQIALWWVFVGILISLVLPIAVSTLKKAKPEGIKNPRLSERLANAWSRYGGTKYLAILAAALLVAGVLLFFTGQSFYHIRDAVLAGFAWESFVNKIYSSK
jgi:hypothetical protein